MTHPSSASRIHAVDVASEGISLDGDGPVRIGVSRRPLASAVQVARRLGFDTAALEQTATLHQANIRDAADAAATLAISQSSGSAARLAELLQQQGGDLQLLGNPQGPYTSVDIPSRIFTTGDIEVHALRAQSFDSMAKVSRSEHEDFSLQEVHFVFPFVNTSGTDQVISVTGVLGLNGLLRASDSGGWNVLDENGHNRLTVSGHLQVFGDSDDQPNFGFFADNYQYAGIDAYEGGWPMSVGAVEAQHITRGTSLQASDLLVKAGSQRIFHLVMRFDCRSSNGSTSYDFNSGDFAVQGFGLFVHITS